MLQTEYVKNLHCNYEKVLLEKKPEERRYQYCILTRGGIKGLLPCSLRYLNGQAYMYYDITSKQNVAQLFLKKKITREWVRDFMWSFQQIQLELGRFLLEEHNILWYPEQIFQDLEQKVFSFLYMPYHEGENGFGNLLDFMVEHVDYEDEVLVGCIYKMYEQYEKNGEIYLQGQILEDTKILEQQPEPGAEYEHIETEEYQISEEIEESAVFAQPEASKTISQEKRGFLSFLDGKRRRTREQKESYKRSIQLAMEGYAVAEDTSYGDDDYGRTVYIEEPEEKKNIIHKLYTPEGKIVSLLDRDCLIIGKKKGEADLVLEDLSISRIHARITREGEAYYLEDMNSTNGTAKNGLKLKPYERRRLEAEDEICLGSVLLIFR